jgi:hypothetical protein
MAYNLNNLKKIRIPTDHSKQVYIDVCVGCIFYKGLNECLLEEDHPDYCECVSNIDLKYNEVYKRSLSVLKKL